MYSGVREHLRQSDVAHAQRLARGELRHNIFDYLLKTGDPRAVLQVGGLRIDPLRQEVAVAGRTVVVTPTELRVLVCLAQHAGSMLSYVQLVACVHGYASFPAEAAELIKPHIHHLRHKLEPDPARPKYVLNVRGKGYCWLRATRRNRDVCDGGWGLHFATVYRAATKGRRTIHQNNGTFLAAAG